MYVNKSSLTGWFVQRLVLNPDKDYGYNQIKRMLPISKA